MFGLWLRQRFIQLIRLIMNLVVIGRCSDNTDALGLPVDIYGEPRWLQMMGLWSVGLDGWGLSCYVRKTKVKHSNNLYIAEG